MTRLAPADRLIVWRTAAMFAVEVQTERTGASRTGLHGSLYGSRAALEAVHCPFACGFAVYLRRCYVAPVLSRTRAGRCGTILDAELDDAATALAARCLAESCDGVLLAAWPARLTKARVPLSLSVTAQRHWCQAARLAPLP